jgi:hypothetical protein
MLFILVNTFKFILIIFIFILLWRKIKESINNIPEPRRNRMPEGFDDHDIYYRYYNSKGIEINNDGCSPTTEYCLKKQVSLATLNLDEAKNHFGNGYEHYIKRLKKKYLSYFNRYFWVGVSFILLVPFCYYIYWEIKIQIPFELTYYKKMFTFGHVFRPIWCLGAAFMGFAHIIYRTARTSFKYPNVSYDTYYPVLIILVSFGVNSFFHIWPNTKVAYVFYPLAFVASFFLTYIVDDLPDIIKNRLANL